jgi:subtilisin-like proprotein convertase family protein
MLGVLLAIASAHGALFTENFNGGGAAIPDGNPTGATFSGNVSDVPSGATVQGLTVSFNISGGYDGDLYGYLLAPNGTKVTLLNQPGVTGSNPFGYDGSGFNVTLSDAAPSNIQTTPEASGVVFSGTYSAAGSLSGADGSVADGSWKLFLADLSSGGGTSTLNSWSLGITAVPEPVTWALIVFVFINLLIFSGRRCWNHLRRRVNRKKL